MLARIAKFFGAGGGGRTLVGRDAAGNRYYEKVLEGQRRRSVEVGSRGALGQQYDPHSADTVPAEWQQWLRGSRREPPIGRVADEIHAYKAHVAANVARLDEEGRLRRSAAEDAASLNAGEKKSDNDGK